MSRDPCEVIDQSAMTFLQILIIAIMFGLNALDGFDILSISLALDGIAKEWGIGYTALGIVSAMELIGMGLGSLLLGSVADKLGRRPTTLSCLVVMATGMLMVATTNSIFALSFWRVVTGVGIGGLLTAITALTAEFSNSGRRDFCISMMAIGYPLGVVALGSIATRLLASYDWRSIFYLGAAVTVSFIPVCYFLVPESVHWLTRKQPSGALEKINRTLKRLEHSTIEALPETTPEVRKKSVGDIFSPKLIGTTIIVSCSYFLHVMTVYFILKWAPKIAADMGFSASDSGNVLVWANVGGAIGGATLGFLTLRFSLKRLTLFVLVFNAIFVVIYGQTPADLRTMSLLCALGGCFGNAGIVGLYALFPHAFPTHARAFGTGFVIGFGRGGSVLSPFLVGILFDSGMRLPMVAAVMAVGSLSGALVLMFLKLRSDDHQRDGSGIEDGGKRGLASSSA
jgi:benzoate transport